MLADSLHEVMVVFHEYSTIAYKKLKTCIGDFIEKICRTTDQ